MVERRIWDAEAASSRLVSWIIYFRCSYIRYFDTIIYVSKTYHKSSSYRDLTSAERLLSDIVILGK